VVVVYGVQVTVIKARQQKALDARLRRSVFGKYPDQLALPGLV
jgi:hypothetical protein